MKQKSKKLLLHFSAWIVGCLMLASCASDLDQYVQDKEKEMLELKKADALLRADLTKKLLEISSELNTKIIATQERLELKIEDEGNVRAAAITDSVAKLTERIVAEAAKTKAYIDEKMTQCKSVLDNRFVQLENARTGLNNELQKAIDDKDAELQAKIKTRLEMIDVLDKKTNDVKNSILALEGSLTEMEELASYMKELEERSISQRERYDEFKDNVAQALEIVESYFTEEMLPDLTTEHLAKLVSWLERVDEALGIAEGYYDDAENWFSEAESAMSDIESVMSDVDSDIAEMISGIEEAVGKAEEVTYLIEDIHSIYDDKESLIGEFASLISNLDALLESVVNVESAHNDLINDAVGLIAIDSSGAYNLFEFATFGFGEAISAYDSISDFL